MSDSTNTKLLERAHEAMEQLTSHPAGLDQSIQQAIDHDDLSEVERLVTLAEGIMSQEDFEANDVL